MWVFWGLIFLVMLVVVPPEVAAQGWGVEGLQKWGLVGGLVLMGVLSHFCKHIIQVKFSKAETFTFKSYWVDNWPQTVLSVVGTASLVLIGIALGDLNPYSAWLAGFSGNSAADMIGARVKGAATK